MATGEKVWSGKDRSVAKPKAKLLPKGEYEFKLQSSKASIGVADRPGAVPYVKGVSLKPLNVDSNNFVFLSVFTSLKPGSDGIVMPERQNGLLALARALGQDLPDIGVLTMQDADGGEIEYLNPKEIVEFLKAADGATLRAHVKIELGRDGYDDKNAISFFVEA